MIYTKTNPTGIDVEIQRCQKLLHSRLSAKWGVNLDAYGRAYLLKRRNVTVPEVFVGGVDYEDVLGVDTNRLFFVQDNISNTYNNRLYETDVDIYFILNLKDIKPSISHRADEEVHYDVDYVLKQSNFNVLNIETGIDNVLGDFNLRDNDNFNLSDFEPYHVFKISCKVKYDLQTTKCNV